MLPFIMNIYIIQILMDEPSNNLHQDDHVIDMDKSITNTDVEPKHSFKGMFENQAFEIVSENLDDDHKTTFGSQKLRISEPLAAEEGGFLDRLEYRVEEWYSSNKTRLKYIMYTLLFVLYNVYLGFAIVYTWDKTPNWCQGVRFLVIITAVVYFLLIYYNILQKYISVRRYRCTPVEPIKKLFRWKYTFGWIWTLIFLAILIFLIIDSSNNRFRLVSFGGLIVYILLGYIFSKHRKLIIWKQVLLGTLLQFLFGLMILRWEVGKELFKCFGEKVDSFLKYTDYGSTFVFGYLVDGKLAGGAPQQIGIFAFKVLSVIFFFSFCTSILYYYGIMQRVIMKVGWFLQKAMGTTACESMNAAGNIFLGMTEAPLLIRPFLPLMTKSEIHAVMTGGFATIAGGVLAAYINFGISPSHLLSASVMSAPAALAYAKLFYPESEISKTQCDDIKMEKGQERNALEAACNGASSAIALVANIAANLIAFLAFIHFVDNLIMWFGSLLGYDFISFEWILSKIFVPLSLLMGVEWKDCQDVARLIGLKTVVNEFVAYKTLSELIAQNKISARSQAIATYALCGFSNIGSIGIQLGGLSALAPDRKSDIASVAVRAMIAGSAACFMTACIAGALIETPS
ncbi:solute carrier family 28 member 3-like [Centruroides sculpturatus]|uniref:solute carrier family 28 member 3-like n=1 Tax=Centruroides sculpturatus TaxID=218467 RepID=UPI000C6DFEA3|nr:solute carrier family 28 member 3-like [Centruroides sculpturatus]